jgi:hypothetical protein
MWGGKSERVMEERRDAVIREIVSTVSAQGFVLDYVLKHLWLEIPKQRRLDLAKALLDASERTDQFHGVSADDHQAERLSDMVVRTQQKIDQMIGRALEATEAAEGSQ